MNQSQEVHQINHIHLTAFSGWNCKERPNLNGFIILQSNLANPQTKSADSFKNQTTLLDKHFLETQTRVSIQNLEHPFTQEYTDKISDIETDPYSHVKSMFDDGNVEKSTECRFLNAKRL